MIGSKDQIEALKIFNIDLPRVQAAHINPMSLGDSLRAPVGGTSDMPITRARRIQVGPDISIGKGRARCALGQRRAADVAEA